MYKVFIVGERMDVVEVSKTDSKEIALTYACSLKSKGLTSVVQFPNGSINNVSI